MKFKLEIPEGKKEYEKRGKTVEAPYGILKQQYHINQLPFINTQHVENIINLYSTAYNINRIFEIIHLTIDENDKYQKFKEEKIQYYKKESWINNHKTPIIQNPFFSTNHNYTKHQ